MKNFFELTAYVWLTFSIIAGIVICASHESQGDVGEHYFRTGNSIYYVGYLGEVNE